MNEIKLAVIETFEVTGEFPAQRASNAENASIRWRHHEVCITQISPGTTPWFTDQS